MPRPLHILFSISVIAILLTGCGKVTQVSSASDENTSFDLLYQLPRLTTANTRIAATAWTPSDNPIYARVIGIKKDGKIEEFSWGRAQLKLSTDMVNGKPVIKRFATAYRKDGVELTNSDYTWTKLSLENDQWKGESKKIKRTALIYIVMIYTESGKMALKSIDAKQTSANRVIQLGEITPYDTFLSLLLLKSAKTSPPFDPSKRFTTLGQLFSSPFFQSLSFSLQSSIKLNPQSPEPDWNPDWSKAFLKLTDLALTNKTDAELWLSKLDTPTLNAQSKTLLLQSLRNLQ